MKKTNKKINTEDRILLLTDMPPCKNYTGGIMISQMLRFLLEEKKSISCFCVVNELLEPSLSEDVIHDINITYVKRPNEFLENKSERKYYHDIKKIQRKLYNYVKKEKITKIWSIIQGEVLVDITNSIFQKTKIEYNVQIWDPIEWWIKDNKFSDRRRAKTLKGFKNALENAKVCMTASNAMNKKYSEEYGVKCITVFPPFESKKIIKTNDEIKENLKFVIALSGQIYAKDAFDNLLNALDLMNWEYNGKEILIEYYGTWNPSYLSAEKSKKYEEKIIKFGFISQEELVKRLSYADLLYCPYFFYDNEDLKKVTELSFPSKLITYLAIDTPILVHAPKYASPYIFAQENDLSYLLDSNKIEEIVVELKKIIEEGKSQAKINNAHNAFEKFFTYEKVKNNLLMSLGIKSDNVKKLNILEVNNVDLAGRRFNGFDLQNEINSNTRNRAKQLVTYKYSNEKNVVEFYKNYSQLTLEWKLLDDEYDKLSVHSQLSLISNVLKNNDYFLNSDVVHYHLLHNTKLSLYQMIELCSQKPTIWTIHDPWNFTGRCVYPQECEKWKNGCEECDYIDNLFALKQDNCNSLWKLKGKVYKELDIDLVVTTPFMLDMVKTSPLTKHFKNVHFIPFGIDLKKFSNNVSVEEARKKLGLNEDDIVIFFRAQRPMKGVEFIVEALEMLETDKKVTLLTCSEIGLVDSLKNKYKVVELGDIQDDQMILAYNACDIFLMPSRGESFGLMAIEAMACSRPIVVFNNSALPSVTFAPECGVLVENKNSYKLMEAIKTLIDKPGERIKRGKLGRKLAEENYNIDKYHERIMNLYETVYQRQKDKEIIELNNYIDFNLTDVQILMKKLKGIYKNILPGKKYNPEFAQYAKEIDKKANDRIDYSLSSVQNLIKEFNAYVYSESNLFQEERKIHYTAGKFRELLYLLKYDRPRVFAKLKKCLSKNKFIYIPLRYAYKAIRYLYRKIKNVLYNVSGKKKKKELENRICYLENEIQRINQKIDIDDEE